jgi:hypothetical protein
MVFTFPSIPSIIARLVKKMTTPGDPDVPYLFPPVFIVDVETWAQKLQAIRLDILNQCFVTSIAHMKMTKGKGHEYLLITVKYGAGSNRPTTQFITDRNIRDDQSGSAQSLGSNSRGSRIVSAPSHSLSPSDSCLTSPSKTPIGADDLVSGGQIKGIIHRVSPSVLLRQTTFPDPGVFVLDLTVLLPLVHSHRPNYIVNENQCYWYADSIYSMAHTLFSGTEQIDPDHGHLRGKYKGVIGIPREDVPIGLTQEFIKMRQTYYKT